jgi:hypothetical protein
MAANTPLVTRQNIERRLGADFTQRILDHNNDGVTDLPTIDEICADASSKVRGGLGLIYDIDTFDPAIATELKRIALDCALAMIARDFQGAYPKDWVALMDRVDLDIANVRKGLANLGTKQAPEPAANQGVRVTSGNAAAPNVYPPKFSDDWGSF